MTNFLDGPAKGQKLMLKRAVTFLRVTKLGKKWDALDQPEDAPHDDENVYAYRIAGDVGMMHLNAGRGRSGFYPIANYKFVPSQPTESEMRSNTLWSGWCERQT